MTSLEKEKSAMATVTGEVIEGFIISRLILEKLKIKSLLHIYDIYIHTQRFFFPVFSEGNSPKEISKLQSQGGISRKVGSCPEKESN